MRGVESHVRQLRADMGHPAQAWLRLRSETDEGEAGSGVELLAEVLGTFGEDDLAGGADVGFLEVSPVGGAVGAADDDVGVDLRLSLFEGDVSDEGEELDLLVEGDDGFVLFSLPVEPAETDRGERADGFEAAAGEALFFGEGLKAGGQLVAGIEDEYPGAGFLFEEFVAHMSGMRSHLSPSAGGGQTSIRLPALDGG